ncbi:MAG: hypothetical protein ACTHJR_16470 [Sphingomonas sp.]|uniref:hypothetical protein n=1 Tax=Sphingomonas sp. TaxID=28214 RepID=UPI003F7CD92F
MKQLPMTPELSDLIHKAVGPDVDTSKLAVFETIALNTLPLPGKDGTIFEKATVAPITLLQMVDYINAGNHIPLIADHELWGAPKGRAFFAGLEYNTDGIEMRMLFYLDPSETALIEKLNAGSLDEVSCAFLSTEFLCSECGWDYFGFGATENIYERTCGNGHHIGEDGVHAEMVGLQQFIELSLVARGAADKPKIVGKSDAKLAPEAALRLAAKGFEPNALVVQASLGKEIEMSDNIQLMKDFTDEVRKTATLTAEKATLTADLTARTSERDALKTENERLTTELAAAKAESKTPEDYESSKSEAGEAVAFLQEQYQHLRVAKGEEKLADDKLPTTVADLKKEINERTANLTAILPVGGVSQAAATDEDGKAKLAFDASAFATRKN